MGRLSALAALGTVALAACDNGPSATSRRSDQIIATAVPAAPPIASSIPPHAPSAARHPRNLCAGDGNVAGRSVPKTPASHAEAPGERPLDGTLASRSGEWTWISFYAAWCGPCKEEIPRLMAWRDRLTSSGVPMHLVFVSLDDDARQLDTFLAAQPVGGLRSSLWLPDGPARKVWAKNLRIAAELPQQALVGPNGRLRCFIEGALDDSDYPDIAALVAH